VPLSDGSADYYDGEGNRSRFGYIDGTQYLSPQEVYDTLNITLTAHLP